MTWKAEEVLASEGALHRRKACVGYDTGGLKPDMGLEVLYHVAQGEKLILSGAP